MGIQGLLPLLKSIHKPTHLRNFAGQTLGVDAYGWLHRGTVACAIELAQGKPTRKHIDFALSRVRMLIHFGVKPYLVFDGDYLPSKAHTEKERASRRKESKKSGLELLAIGRVSQAHLELQKAIDVTPMMARELIEELKRLDVPYVVAPYEADSQLAYLEKQGLISGVLSEDSDLLVFGVKCLLTKLDQYGECIMVNRADFTACREISLIGWTDNEFRMMAMLSGCDYLPGIDKMGLKTAYRLVRKHKVLDRIIRSVQFDGKMKVPAGYLDAFTRAERTFLYQWVFCPAAQCLVNLNSIPAEVDAESMTYIGQRVEPDIAVGVAAGDLDPNTKERLAFNSRLHPAARTRPVQTPDEKQGKPISEFFKPRRTPLAELDPNSFTPSPSQLRLLQNQQGVSWSASQMQTMRPPTLASARSTSGSASAPNATRRAISDQHLDARRHSPKRQRLCSDTAIATSMQGAVGMQKATSRFFNMPSANPSPSTRKASEQRKKQKAEEFDLWSDDSAAEIVAAMTQVVEPVAVKDTPAPKRKKFEVFSDAQQEPLSPTQHTTQDTVATRGSQRSTEEDIPSTSFEVDDSQTEPNAISDRVATEFKNLKSQFVFQSASPRKGVSRTLSAPLPPFAHLRKAGKTQQAAIQANRSKAAHTSDIASEYPRDLKTQVPESSPIALPSMAEAGKSGGEDISDEEWLELEHQEAIPTLKLKIHGSEDLLVPNSPESTDGRKSNPVLNLGKFAFGG